MVELSTGQPGTLVQGPGTLVGDAKAVCTAASADRNLYVNSIDYGSHHFATNAALMSAGTQHFAIS